MRYFNLKYYRFLFLFIFIFYPTNNIFLATEERSSEEQVNKWEAIKIIKTKTKWEYKTNPYFFKDSDYKKLLNKKISNKRPIIRSLGKSVSVNGYLYPDLSIYVPNGFLTDQDRNMTISLRGIGRVRHCKTEKLISNNCSDGIAGIDYSLLKLENFTFDINLTAASLSNRGTDFGEGLSLGFKTAFKEFNNWHLAVGGDHIIHFDEHTDLGRNLYAVASKAFLLNSKEKPAMLFFTAGLGTDFFGYKGNGYLGKLNCFGEKNLTGNGSNKCQIGPIFAGSLALNDRLSFGAEWFGYGFSSGISTRPFKDMPISFSLSVTDFLGDFPKYIGESCKYSPCRPRVIGLASISF